jgi:hypothetical protein
VTGCIQVLHNTAFPEASTDASKYVFESSFFMFLNPENQDNKPYDNEKREFHQIIKR